MHGQHDMCTCDDQPFVNMRNDVPRVLLPDRNDRMLPRTAPVVLTSLRLLDAVYVESHGRKTKKTDRRNVNLSCHETYANIFS
jgi:hypothetical protein